MLGDTSASPAWVAVVTSASRSSAEMLTKFRSGDSTGVDCREVGKVEGKPTKERVVPVGLEQKSHPRRKPSHLGVVGTITNAPGPYLSIRGCGTGSHRRGEHVPFLLLLCARSNVGARHGGHGVSAELGVLALGGGHGHDGLSQTAADRLWGRAGAEQGCWTPPAHQCKSPLQHQLIKKGLMRRCRAQSMPQRCDGWKAASSRLQLPISGSIG